MRFNILRLHAALLLALAALAALATGVRAQNLVTNPGFEAGNFTGYTVVNGGNPIAGILVSGTSPQGGIRAALFQDTIPLDTITQSIATSVGASYNVSFFLQNIGSGNNSFSASFGGVSLLNLVNANAFGYTQFSGTVTATSATSILSFSGYNGPGFYILDTISVTLAAPAAVGVVPEPGTVALLASGVLPLVGMALRKRRRG